MARPIPAPIASFLNGKRFAVAGVSRDGRLPANAIFKKLQRSGYEVIPVNPNAAQLEGAPCYPDVRSIPGQIDGVVFAAHPTAALDCVRQCGERSVPRVWFHRSFGSGSVSDAAVRECQTLGVEPIVGGCPLMYCEPVDPAHRCFRWWFGLRGKIPG